MWKFFRGLPWQFSGLWASAGLEGAEQGGELWDNGKNVLAVPMTTPSTSQSGNPGKAAKSNGFEPLGIPIFRDLWLASIVSNLGSWMQDTAGTWLMVTLTSSPLLIALMQTAASLPVLGLGLLAGATADIYERRRLLIFWQAWMLASRLHQPKPLGPDVRPDRLPQPQVFVAINLSK